VCGQEITTKLFHGFLQLVHTHWGFTARAISHWTLETPSCALWIRRVNPLVHHPSRSWRFQHILAFLTPLFGTYKTHLWWSLQEPVLNMIQVTCQIRGLPATPRNSLKLSVTPNTISKPVTQILPPCCYKKIIHLLSCALVQLINIRPKTNLIPKAMLSMMYPETHPKTRSTRNNREG
jgi:hypothetical protein